MTRVPLTLCDLRELCDRFVPAASRHRDSVHPYERWWHSHEIGHLLTVPRVWHGLPLYGLVDGAHSAEVLMAHERAAMAVSRKLLTTAGCAGVADEEDDDTDGLVLGWDDRGAVGSLLRIHNALRIPRTRERLESLLLAKMRTVVGLTTAAAGRSIR